MLLKLTARVWGNLLTAPGLSFPAIRFAFPMNRCDDPTRSANFMGRLFTRHCAGSWQGHDEYDTTRPEKERMDNWGAEDKVHKQGSDTMCFNRKLMKLQRDPKEQVVNSIWCSEWKVFPLLRWALTGAGGWHRTSPDRKREQCSEHVQRQDASYPGHRKWF